VITGQVADPVRLSPHSTATLDNPDAYVFPKEFPSWGTNPMLDSTVAEDVNAFEMKVLPLFAAISNLNVPDANVSLASVSPTGELAARPALSWVPVMEELPLALTVTPTETAPLLMTRFPVLPVSLTTME
jgi:hypothetical protein